MSTLQGEKQLLIMKSSTVFGEINAAISNLAKCYKHSLHVTQTIYKVRLSQNVVIISSSK